MRPGEGEYVPGDEVVPVDLSLSEYNTLLIYGSGAISNWNDLDIPYISTEVAMETILP